MKTTCTEQARTRPFRNSWFTHVALMWSVPRQRFLPRAAVQFAKWLSAKSAASRRVVQLLVSGTILTSVSAIHITAQGPPFSGRELVDYHHSSWTVEKGFSAVFAMQQAPNGFLWLTTSKGVFRFDGVRLESLDEVTNGAVHNSEIDYAYASPSGNVWLTTVNSGLLLWKNNTVTRYADRRCTPAQSKTGNIAEDAEGTLWIAASSGLYRLKAGTCELIQNDPAFPAGFPWAILLDREGTVWVKWPVGGLYFLRRGQTKFQRTPAGEGASGQRAFLKQAPDGSIWLSDLGGLRKVAGFPRDIRPSTSSPKTLVPAAQFGDFMFAPDGALWAASSTGLNRLESVEQYKTDEPLRAVDLEAFTVNQGLSSRVISDLLVDHEGNVWIATFAGLDQLRRNVFTTIVLPTTPEHQLAIAADDDDGVWIGNREQPLSHVFRDGHMQTYPETQNCTSIRRTSDGAIWSSGTGREHLWRTAGAAPSPVTFPAGDVQGAADIAVDKNHEVWISTFTPESYHRVGDTWSKLTQQLGRKPGVIGAMTGDNNGNVWFAFSRTLVKWDGSEYHRYQFPNDRPMFPVFAIAVRQDDVWMGGSLGIALFSEGHFQFMHWKESQNPGKVNGLIETAAGDLWANGTSGVIRVPKDELKRWRDNPEYAVSANRLDFADGLRSLAVERWPEPSMVESTTGRIWFVTSNGLFWVDPADFDAKMNHVPPPVSINDLVAGGHGYLATNGLRLNPSAGNLEINYTAPSLTVPDRVHFRYKLEGFDTEWQDALDRRQAFYTNLPPGDYTFRVTARNNDGVWNDAGAAFHFVIPPTFTQTIWFKLALVLAGVALVVYLFSLRLAQLRARINERANERMAERERIARDLHDTFFQAIQGLLLRFNTATSKLRRDDPLRALFEEALQQSDKVMLEGRELVLDLRASISETGDLPGILADYGRHLQADQPCEFVVVLNGAVRTLTPLVCKELSIIGKEALNNAFRHSGALRIEAEMNYEAHQFRIRFRDDGTGIDPEIIERGHRDGHWGLPGLRERARIIAAKLEICSRPGAGTEIDVRVAANVAYAENQQPGWRARLRYLGLGKPREL